MSKPPARIVLVGMCPSAAASAHVVARPGLALTGRSGRRLADLAGLRWTEYLYWTERVNLLEEWPGECWPTWYARTRAKVLELRYSGRTVMLMGRAVADAFRLSEVDYLSWWGFRGQGAVAVVPHPSGLNHWWNEPANEARARSFMREVFGGS